MIRKILSYFFSTKLMAVLFIVFAVAMAIGTFVEDRYNTDTARILIYNAWWFEAIMVFFLINFIGNIKRYQLHKKEKWGTLILHLSFIFIIVGAFITRYISYEGIMQIAEGKSENQILSDRYFISAYIDGEYQGEMRRKIHEKPLILSQATDNDFTIKGIFDNIPYEIRYKDYIMGAVETRVEDPTQTEKHLKLVESSTGTRHEHYLKEGEVQNIHNILFAFNKTTPGAINITLDQNDNYTIHSPFGGEYMVMATQEKHNVYADSLQPLHLRSLYNMAGISFVFPEKAMKSKITYTSNQEWKNQNNTDALSLIVKTPNTEKEVMLLGSKGTMGMPVSISQDGLDFTLFFGSKIYELPFAIKLNDFIADKYPGTQNSFSAFKSKVTVEDTPTYDYEIFMNNILDHKGYRFFQSSYNYSNDEHRANFEPDITILSVNHDFWGTNITYVGYALLYISMIWIIFDRNSRFGDLKKLLKKIKERKNKIASVVMLFLCTNILAQQPDSLANATEEHTHKRITLGISEKQIDSLIDVLKVDKTHAEKFGRLIIQDASGRMKPVNTFSSELIRKVYKKDIYKDMNSDQVFLSMIQYPNLWNEVPLISLKRGNDSIRRVLGLEKDTKYASLLNFLDETDSYKLAPYLEDAQKAAVKNAFQKDIIDAHEKALLLSAALGGGVLRIFPVPNDKNNKWISFLEIPQANLKPNEEATFFVKNILPLYFHTLQDAKRATEQVKIDSIYTQADIYLEGITNFQKKHGAEVMPDQKKIDYEILYNKYDIFKKLFSWYLYACILMFLFSILEIFYNNKFINKTLQISFYIVFVLFALHTLGLITRWYISGHAPWSNAYESMIYVGWATMLFGLIFGRNSYLTTASTTFVTAMILMIAHWNWLDPQIGTLQPVLNSYWLMIHVSIIVGSYGPFAIGMILGVVALLLMIFTNENNKQRMELNIKELTYINEMALTIGLVMLTIGNFLGGQWANESWGRYWGWDPKETWALISIMVYAFVIHARLVPGLRGLWFYNLISIYAFASIVMTYFGVNFYLTGLHSYASGEKVVTPSFVYYSISIVAFIGILSYFKYRKFFKK